VTFPSTTDESSSLHQATTHLSGLLRKTRWASRLISPEPRTGGAVVRQLPSILRRPQHPGGKGSAGHNLLPWLLPAPGQTRWAADLQAAVRRRGRSAPASFWTHTTRNMSSGSRPVTGGTRASWPRSSGRNAGRILKRPWVAFLKLAHALSRRPCGRMSAEQVARHIEALW